jgi:O-antigen ligase
VGLALAFPFVAALTVVGTYLGKEIIIFALWVGLGVAAFLFVRPIVGIAAITSVLLFTAYPTLLQTLGFLTINNLLGICFLLLLALHVLETRDLSFVRVPQVLVLVAIGLVFLIATLHADSIFPLLQQSRGRGRVIDRTEDMATDFVTRLGFLVFIWAFVRTRSDIRVLFLTFMLALFLAVPSALWNFLEGTLNRGFRAAASVTAGSNPNRLAMICLMEVACWWFWAQARPGVWRRLTALGAIAMSLIVLLVTGSRSGLLGFVVLGILLQTGPRGFRVAPVQVGAMAIVGWLVVVTVVPAATWTRMINFFPDPHSVGASSSEKREEAIETGVMMVRDHPVLGIGLGNFREVARQVYRDKYYRPPHNSYLWAATQGGLACLLLYGVLLVITWRDLRVIMRHAALDPEIAHMAAALRVVFLLYCFFGFFADLWLNPITYVILGLVATMRRHVESIRIPAAAVVRVPRRLPAFRTA